MNDDALRNCCSYLKNFVQTFAPLPCLIFRPPSGRLSQDTISKLYNECTSVCPHESETYIKFKTSMIITAESSSISIGSATGMLIFKGNQMSNTTCISSYSGKYSEQYLLTYVAQCRNGEKESVFLHANYYRTPLCEGEFIILENNSVLHAAKGSGWFCALPFGVSECSAYYPLYRHEHQGSSFERNTFLALKNRLLKEIHKSFESSLSQSVNGIIEYALSSEIYWLVYYPGVRGNKISISTPKRERTLWISSFYRCLTEPQDIQNVENCYMLNHEHIVKQFNLGHHGSSFTSLSSILTIIMMPYGFYLVHKDEHRNLDVLTNHSDYNLVICDDKQTPFLFPHRSSFQNNKSSLCLYNKNAIHVTITIYMYI